jgi:hypothetical protein
MKAARLRKPSGICVLAQYPLTLIIVIVAIALPTFAQKRGAFFQPGNLVVSRTVYDNNPNNVYVGELLPPNCQATQAGCNGNATNNGSYPSVWNNNLVDGSFGITSKIFLDQFTPAAVLSIRWKFPIVPRREFHPRKIKW